ncbi:ficolin-3-like [Haliotis rubra]|uniref:ficolin-3-like n=1 Tax=Haliotis rubra TaxID=36100 RepID=UPI001EE63649|nr:ficolin-3-like [Haliotis rubra]
MCDSAFFNRSWSEYASGFGEPDSCFWLGNNKIRALTKQADYNLQVGTRSSLGEWQKGFSFYTYDESHGTNSTCAIVGGGWWYGDDCDHGNLNDLRGPRWLNDQGNLTFYNESTMAITPADVIRYSNIRTGSNNKPSG